MSQTNNKNEVLTECTQAINRFSNFSKWWASVNLLTLSTFFVGLTFLILHFNILWLKIVLIIVYACTIILCNLIAINYLALEKSARNQYKKIRNKGQEKINWPEVKVLPNFCPALKSWSILIPLFIYFIYVTFLIVLAFV